MSLVNRRELLLTGLLAGVGCGRRLNRATLYCAQDREFAEAIIEDFRAAHGADVAVKFDTEAQKSVSLYEEILRETQRPRCDVFWNNEILNTIRLQRAGVIRPITAPSGEFPAWARPEHGLWRAFAARPRVLIVNTNLVNPDSIPTGLLQLSDPKWKNRLAMAKPQFGTTATQAACLFDVLGERLASEFYRGLIANQIAILPGNKPVAQAVADGRFPVGLTDSDDAIGEIEDGRPVTLVLPDRDGHSDHPKMGTLLIPNTVSIVRGSPNAEMADRLVNFLLSPEVERRLAEGGGYQIPLNAEVNARSHQSLAPLARIKAMKVDWEHATDLWEVTQTFLRNEFAR